MQKSLEKGLPSDLATMLRWVQLQRNPREPWQLRWYQARKIPAKQFDPAALKNGWTYVASVSDAGEFLMPVAPLCDVDSPRAFREPTGATLDHL